MFVYEKKLQYPVKITNPNPKLAKVIITQYGGPDGTSSLVLFMRPTGNISLQSRKSERPCL
jgi:Mn-containing catalase